MFLLLTIPLKVEDKIETPATKYSELEAVSLRSPFVVEVVSTEEAILTSLVEKASNTATPSKLPQQKSYSEVEIMQLIAEKGSRSVLLSDLNACEAGGRHDNMWGDSGTSYGGFMFKYQTFQTHCVLEGLGTNWKDFKDQLNCAEDMIFVEKIGDTFEGWYNCFRMMNLSKYPLD